MTPLVRPAGPDDFATLAQLWVALWPQRPISAETLAREHQQSAESRLPLRRGYLLALLEGQPAGFAVYGQHPGAYHPQKFWLELGVRPDAQRRGVGRALAAALREALAPHDPLALDTQTREDQTRGLALAGRYGFLEAMRTFESRLDLTTFDFAPFARLERLPPGYRLSSYAEEQRDPEFQRRLYRCFSEVRRDVPRPEAPSDFPFEDFVRRNRENEQLIPQGYLLAVHEASGEYAGLTQVERSDGAHLQTGLTGVRREHRQLGLATALKLAGLHYAVSTGAREIRTENATSNLPMLGINERLGFVREAAWVTLQWVREG